VVQWDVCHPRRHDNAAAHLKRLHAHQHVGDGTVKGDDAVIREDNRLVFAHRFGDGVGELLGARLDIRHTGNTSQIEDVFNVQVGGHFEAGASNQRGVGR